MHFHVIRVPPLMKILVFGIFPNFGLRNFDHVESIVLSTKLVDGQAC